MKRQQPEQRPCAAGHHIEPLIGKDALSRYQFRGRTGAIEKIVVAKPGGDTSEAVNKRAQPDHLPDRDWKIGSEINGGSQHSHPRRERS